VLRRPLDRRGQRGLSLLETLIGVTLSGLLLSPMMAWAAVSMQQQRSIVQRNLSGASLGVLRTVIKERPDAILVNEGANALDLTRGAVDM